MTTTSATVRNDSPLVSIVINNYNYAAFLGAAIDCSLAQSHPNIEVIVVDDGSTDDSAAVMTSFGKRIKSVLKPNGGQASAYNRGFQESSGQFVLFLDADDLLDADAIAESVAVWQPGVAKVHFYLRLVEGSEAIYTGGRHPTNTLAEGNLIPQLLQAGHYDSPPASGNLYPRDVLAKLLPMPEPEWRIAADTYTVYLSPFFGEVRACHKTLGCYRVHGKNRGAQTRVDGVFLRRLMGIENQMDEMLFHFCASRDFPYRRGTAVKKVAYAKVRLASLVVDPAHHPFPEDRRYHLLWTTIMHILYAPGNTLKSKCLIVAWALAIATCPARYVERLLTIGFVPIKRPSLIQSLTRRLSRVAQEKTADSGHISNSTSTQGETR